MTRVPASLCRTAVLNRERELDEVAIFDEASKSLPEKELEMSGSVQV